VSNVHAAEDLNFRPDMACCDRCLHHCGQVSAARASSAFGCDAHKADHASHLVQ
jgi:hypothetical protein